MIKCDSCGWTNFDGAKYCEKCGSPLQNNFRYQSDNENELDKTHPIGDNKGKSDSKYSIVVGIIEILVGLVFVIYPVAVYNKTGGFLYYLGFVIAVTGVGHISAVIKKNKENR